MRSKAGIAIYMFLILAGCRPEEEAPGSGIGSGDEEVLTASTRELLPGEYVQWVQDKENGLNKEKVVEDIIYTLQYKPQPYMVCVSERTDDLQDSVLRAKQEELGDVEYFELRIGLKSGQGELLKHGITSAGDYEKRVKYFAFEMQKDIKFVMGNDTLPCEMYHFERAYDIVPFSSFIIGFPRPKENGLQDMTFIVHDRIFQKGIIKFRFTRKELYNIPKLKTI